MRKLAVLLLAVALATSAFAGGWKWKASKRSTAGPTATLIGAGYTDGWSWGEDSE